MASVNKVIIIGHLGRDPESREMGNGDTVCNIAVATSETWKDKNSGEKKEQTEWHRITLYRRLGEVAAEYLQKGSQVYIEGRLQTRKWTDKDGTDRYTTEIIATEMKMLGSRQGGRQEEDEEDRPQRRVSDQRQERPASKPAPKPAPNFDDMDDDIPF